MKRTLFFIVLLTFSGCSSSGIFSSANLTNVELSEANYTIVARGITGTAQAPYLLGLSGSFRSEMKAMALIKLGGPDFLYTEAMNDFWNKFEQETNSSVVGRNLALVNVRYDSEAINLFLYTKPKVAITADVIEFTD
ncbi:MAG: DUF6567 family protein [Cyclobacteriaceae bacterium]